MIKIGQKISFDPFKGIRCHGMHEIRHQTTGTVTYINSDHSWFSAVYDLEGIKQRTSFNFSDNGYNFKVVEG